MRPGDQEVRHFETVKEYFQENSRGILARAHRWPSVMRPGDQESGISKGMFPGIFPGNLVRRHRPPPPCQEPTVTRFGTEGQDSVDGALPQ